MIAIGARFIALQDFESEETASGYVTGLSYTVESEKLAALVERWIRENKVEIGGIGATMTARGDVKWQ